MKESLERVGDRFGVAVGSLDPVLLGTFRHEHPEKATQGMLTLLVARTNLTFYAEYVASCESPPCETVPVEGDYRQFRELPDPTRAAGLALNGQYRHPGSDNMVPLYFVLRRAWIEGSPQLGLYHNEETPEQGGRPFFTLAHPEELWCRTPTDCDLQDGECGGSFACEANTCRCR